EAARTAVHVESRRLELKSSDDQIRSAVPVGITPVYPHARLLAPFAAEGGSTFQARVGETAASIEEKIPRHAVIGQIEIRSPVAVGVRSGNAQGLAMRGEQAGLPGGLDKRAAPEIPIQMAQLGVVLAGRASGLHAAEVAESRRRRIKADVAADIEVQ